jgi:hypothetical protein
LVCLLSVAMIPRTRRATGISTPHADAATAHPRKPDLLSLVQRRVAVSIACSPASSRAKGGAGSSGGQSAESRFAPAVADVRSASSAPH